MMVRDDGTVVKREDGGTVGQDCRRSIPNAPREQRARVAQLCRDPNTFDIDAAAAYCASPGYSVGPDGVARLVATRETSRSKIAAFVERLKHLPEDGLAARGALHS